jgi:hypothetical protein
MGGCFPTFDATASTLWVGVSSRAGFDAVTDSFQVVTADLGSGRVGATVVPGVFTIASNGRRLAFVKNDGLYVADLDGGNARLFVPRAPGDILDWDAFSPDGESFVYVRMKALRDAGAIEVTAADGSRHTVLESDRLWGYGGTHVEWPEPERLVYVLSQKLPERPDTEVMEVRIGADFAPVAPPRRLWRTGEGHIAWLSAAGKRVLVDRAQSQKDAYVLALDGATKSAPKRVTQSDADEVPAGWLPDGRLVFTSDANRITELFAQAPGAREATHIATSPVGSSSVTIMPGGDLLVWRVPTRAGEACELLRAKPEGAARVIARVPNDPAGSTTQIGCETPIRCARDRC